MKYYAFLARDSYEVDLEFKGLSVKDMIESSMQGWVHHVQSILPQGRCTWFDPFQKPEDDFEDEDLDEDEEEKLDVAEPETGPPLLSSAADDERENIFVFYAQIHIFIHNQFNSFFISFHNKSRDVVL